MPDEKLTRIEKVALAMLRHQTNLIYMGYEPISGAILSAFAFAEVFEDICNDPEMTWNKAKRKVELNDREKLIEKWGCEYCHFRNSGGGCLHPEGADPTENDKHCLNFRGNK